MNTIFMTTENNRIVGAVRIEQIYEIVGVKPDDELNWFFKKCLKMACMTEQEFSEYAKGGKCYGYVISSYVTDDTLVEGLGLVKDWIYFGDDVMMRLSNKEVDQILNDEQTMIIRRNYPILWTEPYKPMENSKPDYEIITASKRLSEPVVEIAPEELKRCFVGNPIVGVELVSEDEDMKIFNITRFNTQLFLRSKSANPNENQFLYSRYEYLEKPKGEQR